jgi:CRP/FNR family transcriptional regulator, cyclic AMP receptor protein
VLTRASKRRFDPKVFLATVAGGRSSSTYRKDAVIFSQGDAADSVFCVQDGKVKAV